MVSESAVYVLLVHYYHVENRGLRQWITHEVVPCLRDEWTAPCSPCLSCLQWPGLSVSMSDWRSEAWIRLRDMPRVLAVDEVRGKVRVPWWRSVFRGVRLG